MVNSRCVSSNRQQETIIALHRPYSGHLEHVFLCRMTPSICKTKTDFKILRKCLNSSQMVNSRCVSSNRHQETIIALHRPYSDHLEHVFVLQNDPLNLQNEDRLQNTTKVLKLIPDGKKWLCYSENSSR